MNFCTVAVFWSMNNVYLWFLLPQFPVTAFHIHCVCLVLGFNGNCSDVWKYQKIRLWSILMKVLSKCWVEDLTRSEMVSVKKHTSTQVHKYMSTQTQAHKYASSRTCTQAHKHHHASTQAHKYTSALLYTFMSCNSETLLLAGPPLARHTRVNPQVTVFNSSPWKDSWAAGVPTFTSFSWIGKKDEMWNPERGRCNNSRWGVSAQVGMEWPTMWPVMLHPGHLPPTSLRVTVAQSRIKCAKPLLSVRAMKSNPYTHVYILTLSFDKESCIILLD